MMCVVVLVETVRPSDTQIEQMWDANPRGGGGVAWRALSVPKDVGIPEGTPVVRWEKGLDKKEMLEMNKTLSLPYMLHFRQPSADTSDSLLACHPFQVDDQATTGFSGVTTGWVLFHNGHWAEWRRKLEALALSAAKRLPSGAWSDSRGLAWAAHWLGFGILEMINEKVLCFGSNQGDEEMFGGPWLNVKGQDSEQTFIVSNKTWERGITAGFMGIDRRNDTSKLLAAAHETTTGGKSGGTSQEMPFPSAIGGTSRTAGAQGDQQEQVQEGSQGTVTGGIVSTPGSSTLRSKRPCTACKKHTNAGVLIGMRWHCYQCWSKADLQNSGHAQDALNETLWVGICQRCRIGSSGMKTVLGDQWLCHACWETNGKPKIYYARERGVVEKGA